MLGNIFKKLSPYMPCATTNRYAAKVVAFDFVLLAIIIKLAINPHIAVLNSALASPPNAK